MRQGNNTYLTLFFLYFFNQLQNAHAKLSELTVVDDIQVDHTNDSIKLIYNATKYAVDFDHCFSVAGDFAVDSSATLHKLPVPVNDSDIAADFFNWTQSAIQGHFSSPLNEDWLTSVCLVQNTTELVCQTGELAVYYTSGFPFRENTITFLLNAAEAVFCRTGLNGFLVGGYQSLGHVSATVSPSPFPSESASPSPFSAHGSDDSDLAWLIPVVVVSALLMCGVGALCVSRTAREWGGTLFSRDQNRFQLLPNREEDSLCPGL